MDPTEPRVGLTLPMMDPRFLRRHPEIISVVDGYQTQKPAVQFVTTAGKTKRLATLGRAEERTHSLQITRVDTIFVPISQDLLELFCLNYRNCGTQLPVTPCLASTYRSVPLFCSISRTARAGRALVAGGYFPTLSKSVRFFPGLIVVITGGVLRMIA